MLLRKKHLIKKYLKNLKEQTKKIDDLKKNKKKSLSLCKKKSENRNTHIPKKTAKALQHTHLLASFTVEAACILPIYLFTAALLLGLFQVLQTEAEMTEAVQKTARSLAVSYGETDGGIAQEVLDRSVLLASAKHMIWEYLKTGSCWEDCIDGGYSGISLNNSDVKEDAMNIQVSYKIQLPVAFFGFDSVSVAQGVNSRKWVGYRENGSADADWVYVTETGSAYHSSTDCRYLDLSIHSVPVESVGKLRNKDGAIYYPCSCCLTPDALVGIAYVTDYGRKYHSDISCSDLKRTVYRIRLSEVAGRHPCPACYKEGNP